MYFLGSIFLHMKALNCGKISQNFSTWQFFLHKYNLWYLWQIWALLLITSSLFLPCWESILVPIMNFFDFLQATLAGAWLSTLVWLGALAFMIIQKYLSSIQWCHCLYKSNTPPCQPYRKKGLKALNHPITKGWAVEIQGILKGAWGELTGHTLHTPCFIIPWPP